MSKEKRCIDFSQRRAIIGTASILALTAGGIFAIQKHTASMSNHGEATSAQPPDCTAEAMEVMRKIQEISRLFSETETQIILQELPVAEDDNEAQRKAKEFYKDGIKLYDLGDFRGAVEKFTHGYSLRSDAAFLFNLGQCYRQMGEADKAIFSYKRFLSRKPNAPNRLAVERFIKELETLRQVHCGNASRVLQAAETLAVREPYCLYRDQQTLFAERISRFRTLFAQNCHPPSLEKPQVPDTNPKAPENPVYQRTR